MATDGSGGEGGVDISGWSLHGREGHGRTPFLVGPVVGTVTEETGRVLVEVNVTQLVAMEAFMDGESVFVTSQEVIGRTPTPFTLRGFQPGKRIRVVVSAGGQEREARFTTTSNKQDWKIATVSCNCHTYSEKLGLWERLARVTDEVDCLLHLGDQIYGDSDFEIKNTGVRFESAWHASLTILEPIVSDEWASHSEEVLELYRNTYRTTWNVPHTAKVLASVANYMICDDHEFTDDIGDEPEHCNPSTVEFFVARLAYRAYNEYQRQLLEDVDVTDVSIKAYYAFKLSPRVGFFMTDNRIERSLHRHQATKPEWENRGFLGPAQWDRMTTAFDVDFADCDLVLFGTPTPLVFLSNRATWLAQKKIDDARGTWGHKNFKIEQRAVAHMLTEWQNTKPNRALITLAGDVHMGGFTDSWHLRSSAPLHQLTASAVGNTPEGGIDDAMEIAIRTSMHLDERMFSFRVSHYEWIYGPNYGMVDARLSDDRGGRPEIALTLVPQTGRPKIRNLEFGNSKVKVKSPTQSQASVSAHATAKIMEVAPKGDHLERRKKKTVLGRAIGIVGSVSSAGATAARATFR